ncbi:uncharacterized protein LOC133890118 isoform X3 [Phragmites australis]|uniref:uncharacterized protein LOC133890118 isoform X3 n=1 Tax=Phragmites australis TaxID=29695 RepID=UPI002D78CBE2|nr:uncharacterized protein LOC133890118 isoform X3 [Phragmites australis]
MESPSRPRRHANPSAMSRRPVHGSKPARRTVPSTDPRRHAASPPLRSRRPVHESTPARRPFGLDVHGMSTPGTSGSQAAGAGAGAAAGTILPQYSFQLCAWWVTLLLEMICRLRSHETDGCGLVVWCSVQSSSLVSQVLPFIIRANFKWNMILLLLKLEMMMMLLLLGRVFNILRENNPDLASDRRRTVMRPPQVLREATKKTVFVNFMDLCKTIHRQPEHVMMC